MVMTIDNNQLSTEVFISEVSAILEDGTRIPMPHEFCVRTEDGGVVISSLAREVLPRARFVLREAHIVIRVDGKVNVFYDIEEEVEK